MPYNVAEASVFQADEVF